MTPSITGSDLAGPGLVVGLGVAAMVGLVVAAWWFGRLRERRLRAWAAAAGWTYVGTDPGYVGRWQGLPFGRGSSRRATEVLVGSFAGRPATAFVYRYTTGSGDDKTTHTYHVCALALPAWLPTVQLTPEGVVTRIASAFGAQDIELESTEFNRVWRVEATDAKLASDVLHPRTMERLLRPDARGLGLRIEGTDVLCWEPGGHDLDALAARLGVLAALVEAIPRFVWLDHGWDPAAAPGAGGAA